MFAKSKISQSMIDAVNKVLGEQPVEQKDQLLNEAGAPIKEPTPTGVRVYGSSYGNSAKAKKDQTKSPVDNLKGPKDKEMKEAAKPDFLDMDKDGNKKEPMKKAVADKNMKEELKGNQDKIDANNNNKIDGQDFKILKAKKKVKEGREFTEKLLEMVRKSDVPAYLRKAKGDTPLTMADVKAPKKDSISAPENLAKARNEEVELNEALDNGYKIKMKHSDKGRIHAPTGEHIGDVTKETGGWRYHGGHHSKWLGTESGPHYKTGVEKTKEAAANKVAQIHHSSLSEEVEHLNEDDFAHAKKQGWSVSHHYHHTKVTHPKHGIVSIDRYGEWMHHPDQDYLGRPKGDLVAHGQFDKLNKHLSSLKEGYEPSDAPITTDTLAGRMPGGKSNSFKSFKTRVKPLAKQEGETETPDTNSAEKTSARSSIKAEEVQVEATIAGTSGWEPMKKDVKDKSGAVHTPMSRAKDLARQAFKTVQNKTKVK